MDSPAKRLFFGLETFSPWPEALPEGRILDECDRHMTLAFLGRTEWEKMEALLPAIPKPQIKTGLSGAFEKCLFLPKRRPNVVAWKIHWLEEPHEWMRYRETLLSWLKENNFEADLRHPEFLPHVTVARGKFSPKEWSAHFHPLPLYTKDLCLYESLGHSKYQTLWRFPISAPFEVIDHTADEAYLVRGNTLEQLLLHAKLALCFFDPLFLDFISLSRPPKDLNEIVESLNRMVTEADMERGCSLKAVSYHGSLRETENGLLEWEMILDV